MDVLPGLAGSTARERWASSVSEVADHRLEVALCFYSLHPKGGWHVRPEFDTEEVAEFLLDHHCAGFLRFARSWVLHLTGGGHSEGDSLEEW